MPTYTLGASIVALAVALGVLLGGSPLWGQECPVAGARVVITAQSTGTDTLVFTYRLINHARVGMRWVRIGSDAERVTPIVPDQMPTVLSSPPGWRGQVIVPEETSQFHLWWETEQSQDPEPARSDSLEFRIKALAPDRVRTGLIGMDGRPVRAIDFHVLPFMVGDATGGCWTGTVVRTPSVPE